MDLQQFVRSLILLFYLLEVFFAVTLSRHVHQAHNRHHHHLNHLNQRHKRHNHNRGAHVILGSHQNFTESGPWGEWNDSTECSRTCGGGVTSQTRDCKSKISDSSEETSETCVGPSKRYFSCNIQDCPEGAQDFRAEQCSKFDNVKFEGKLYQWVPYLKAHNKCELICMPVGERFYFSHAKKVIDGTRCEPNSLDICVDGECKAVGCDMMLGSPTKEDVCRECGGDGSSCKTVEGVFDIDNLQIGYNDILLIPSGATNILIQEREPTNNYLAVRNLTGYYYLNGNWRIDFPRDMHFAGTTFYYERKSHGIQAPEVLKAVGPTSESIFIVLLYQETNSGIDYEYSIPAGVSAIQPDTYSWVHGEYGECSRTCGGGYQSRTVNCSQTNNFEIVAEYLCDPVLQPASNTTCKTEPCPPEWHIGEWEECSSTCGGGVQFRLVYCQQIQHSDTPTIINHNICLKLAGPKPIHTRKCNQHIKCPQWHAGPWSICNKMCGEGEQTRSITCQKHDNGTIQLFPHFACDANLKPQSKQKCKSAPCEGVDWIVSDWTGCDRCGLLRESRLVHCSNKTGNLFPDRLCDNDRQPDFMRDCPDSPPCDVMWHATEWSECSAKCGTGIQTRKVFCGTTESEMIQKVQDEKCDTGKKYDSIQNCTSRPCKGMWFSGPWNRCSTPCGGGQRTRKILCLLEDDSVVHDSDCDPSEQPLYKDTCNQHSCDEDEIMVVGGCKESKYGCCPDGITQAGPNREDCLKDPLPEEGCSVTEFGCCSDGISAAIGPFNEGCTEITKCEDTKFKCCPDGISPAKGPKYKGCPPISTCADSRYGCCPDGKEAAKGKNYAGCKNVIGLPCNVTEFGCCPDGVTAATGADALGCNEDEGSGLDCTEAAYGCCPDGVTEALGGNFEGCDDIPIPVEPVTDFPDVPECENSEFGCCKDGLTPAKGLKFSGCETNETTQSNCVNTVFGCCPDGVTAAKGANNEGCLSTTTEDCLSSSFGCCLDGITAAKGWKFEGCETPPPFNCWETAHGCCQDKRTPALGPGYKGCPCETSFYGCCPDGLTIATSATYEGCDCEITEFGCCPDQTTEAKGPNFEGCGCHASNFGCCPDGETDAQGPNYEGCCSASPYGCCPDHKTLAIGPNFEGCPCDNSRFGCCPDGVTLARGPNQEGCHCEFTQFGCCADGKTLATGPDQAGCRCEASLFGCCPDGVTAASGPSNYGCPCHTSSYGCCPDGVTIAHGPNNEGCMLCERAHYGCCPDGQTEAQGPNYEGCDCNRSYFGCCPDGITISRGPNYEGCHCETSPYGCCYDQKTPAHGPNYDGCPCETSQFGCCLDQRTPARGPSYEGCSCEQMPFGCCPDQVSAAHGPDYAGCPCHTTPFGCCPDGYTIAHGPNNENCDNNPNPGPQPQPEGCQHSQFGCCPDNIHAATGPHFAGCPCEQTVFGCCLDGRTPSHGPNYQGCGCQATHHGCCPDGIKAASGPNHEGCTEVVVLPGTKPGEVCGLPKEAGTCSNFTVKWFFDMDYGGCSRFWFGGCDGNDNQFDSQEECEQVCVTPEGMDACHLPRVSGPCDDHTLMWYFDVPSGQCGQFYYGGCLGNNNRFATQAECESTCTKMEVLDTCLQPKVEGPCPGEFVRWFYDSTSSTCRQFRYGGCKGNKNNFESEHQCRQQCGIQTETDICTMEKAEGSCQEHILNWFYDPAIKRCLQFYYSGCDGNQNRFSNEMECQKACSTADDVMDVCSLTMDPGPCSSTEQRWVYHADIGRCSIFAYSGCGGNKNNFETQEECENRCLSPVAKAEEFKIEDCFVEKSYGICADNIVHWYYDKNDGVCKQFYYSGCNGNNNRFATRQECEQRCFHSQDICRLPKIQGPCSAEFKQWYFNAENDICEEFTFGGCEGNGNRFDSQTECDVQCRKIEVTHAAFTTLRPRVIDPCSMPKDTGPCESSVINWYYNNNEDKCEQFVYGGCEGNTNRFGSEESCERACGLFKGQDVCALSQDPGPCLGAFQKWYHDPNDQTCKSFIYGGCQGNGNRFPTKKECEQICVARRFNGDNDSNVIPAEICMFPADPGPCTDSFPRWYYVAERETCIPFSYGGCGGNRNRFKTFEICLGFCSAPTCPEVPDCSTLDCAYGASEVQDHRGCLQCSCNNPCEGIQCPDGQVCIAKSNYNDRGIRQGHPTCTGTAQEPIATQPSFEEEPRIHPSESEIRALSNSTVHLPCVANGNPRPVISWFKDNQPVVSDGVRYTILENGSLIIRNSNIGDGAMYMCIANNNVGTPAEDIIRLVIEEPARILPSARVVLVVIGNPCILDCRAVGYPPPKVSWWKGVLMLPQFSEQFQQYANFSLLIRTVAASDLGNYFCLANNGVGKETVRWDVSVTTKETRHSHGHGDDYLLPEYEPSIARSASFLSEPNENYLDETEKATSLQVSEMPLEKHSMKDSKHDLVLSSKMQLDDFDYINHDPYQGEILSDQGYEIIDKNETTLKDDKYVVSQLVHKIASEEIYYPDNSDDADEPYHHPILNDETGDVDLQPYAKEEHDLSNLDKTHYESIIPNSMPTKHADLLSQEDTLSPSIPTETTILPSTTVSPVTEHETIDYRTVVVAAKITSETTNFGVGNDIRINCETEGSEDISWYKDGSLLQADSRTQIMENGTLIIYKAAPADTATYRCEASNSYNVASTSISITVDGFQLHPNCTDNPYFANCKLIVKAKYCINQYYARFCCKSCTLAGQLDIEDFSLS